MGLTMSDDGGLELFVEFFVAAASLALTSSSFAVVSSSLRVVWSSCLTTASNFRSNSLKRCSHRSQSGHPFPVLMDDDSTRNRRILEHRFQAVNSYRLLLASATRARQSRPCSFRADAVASSGQGACELESSRKRKTRIIRVELGRVMTKRRNILVVCKQVGRSHPVK